ncbi:alpha-galactosidase [Agromyces laixinhei]|uniref:alpha-galactosidase n=1 Tax=Agromyces laixinhei TaxID=2585717 RepID=UPI0018DD8392|nr:alpha-galactosidase [Agromyces laixinhei]
MATTDRPAKAGLAVTPPMGWNSWNRFRCYELNEDVVVQTADAMVASGMRDAGYDYLVVDDCWQAHRRDGSGRLQSHPRRFASGMAALGEEIHARGLKFGMYLAPGRKTCAMIYDRYHGEALGSFGHEQEDLETLAGWGVDYLKYDWCRANRGGTGLSEGEAFRRMAEAIGRSDRPMVYSISEYGRTKPWTWAPEVAHLWRTTGDIAANWRSVMRIADRQHALAPFAGPGGWNDPDMLEVGNAGLSGIESRSHFMMWAMLAAPLMAGNDLRTMDEPTRQVLTNPGVLAISQDPLGRQGSRTARHRSFDVWHRDLADGTAVGILNRTNRAITARVAGGWLTTARGTRLARLGEGARNAWTGRPAPDGELTFSAHEMHLFRVRAA